jgi:hypothetical protein
MWKVFGEEGLIVQFETLWIARIRELSKRMKDRDRFLKLLDSAEMRYHTDVHQKLHVFKMTLPTSCSADDVLFMKSFVQRIIKSTEYPMVDLDGVEQRAALIITAEEEEDDHKTRMASWYKQLEEMNKK